MKKVLTGIFIVGISLSCMIEKGNPLAEKGNLSGIVTYQDVYTSAKQTDAGAEIYVVNEADIRSTEFENTEGVLGNFQYLKFNYLLSINTVIDPAKIKKAQDIFDDASDLALKHVRGFKKLPAVVRATANATGKYTLNLKPGRYNILVISGSAKSNNSAESTGNLDYKIVDVRSAGETILDVNFIKHQRIISFALVPAGC